MIPVFFVKDDLLSSPLEIAAGKGHTEIVEKLISAGAVINYQDKVREFQPIRELLLYSLSSGFQKIIASNFCPLKLGGQRSVRLLCVGG